MLAIMFSVVTDLFSVRMVRESPPFNSTPRGSMMPTATMEIPTRIRDPVIQGRAWPRKSNCFFGMKSMKVSFVKNFAPITQVKQTRETMRVEKRLATIPMTRVTAKPFTVPSAM